jgi:RsiW-degrading membrane proteinase PrsW (M82 family)
MMTAVADRPVRRLLSLQLRWIAVLVVGSTLYAAVLLALLGTGDVLYLPSLLLLGAAVVPLTFITFLDGLDRDGLSFAQIATTAAVGGVVGVVIAGSLEYETARQFGALPTWTVGLIEESAKLAVPAALFLLWRRLRPLDGVVLGVAAGSAFAVLETMGYGFVQLLQSGGNLDSVTQLLLVRSVTEPGGHAAWTGLACAALFSIRGSRRRWLGWLRFLVVFAGVVWLHSTWDSLATTDGYLTLAAVSFILLMAATWWLHRDRPEHAPSRRAGSWPVPAALVDYPRVDLPAPRGSATPVPAFSRPDDGSQAAAWR